MCNVCQAQLSQLTNKEFVLQQEKYGLSVIRQTKDSFATNFISSHHLLGEIKASVWTRDSSADFFSSEGEATFLKNGRVVEHWSGSADGSAKMSILQQFNLKDSGIDWKFTLVNNTDKSMVIEDLSIPIFYNNDEIEDSKEIFEQRVIQHQYLSGDNSFIFWQRPSGNPPYLLMLPLQGTSLEFFNTSAFRDNGNVFQCFIHSRKSQRGIKGTWRQPATNLTLTPYSRKTYGFRLTWANDYEQIRTKIVQAGGINFRIAPGMTIPSDLNVSIALESRQAITSIQSEYPAMTKITYGKTLLKNYKRLDVAFSRLGENKLKITYGKGYTTYLEFFVTEPLEILYKKRASFLVTHQQHKDSTKWYNGLFSLWDMKNHILRGPDNDDGFNQTRLTYVLTCDDPILGKAPFLAAKNVVYPDQSEIDALEYYVAHYVWGGLQRTDKEHNPYGIYGTPNWKIGRDSALRAKNVDDPNRTKMHIWRSYDYPHIIMMYYHLYQIASLYPATTHYLDKQGYLKRTMNTIKAFFTYPYQILPWYETYKWGCYNEILIPEIIDVLKKEGLTNDAEWIRQEWEKKVKYFIYDDPYPFRSEYAVDATAYESTGAFAKYAMEHPLKADTLLWYDKNLKRWYSHSKVSAADARRFMEKQLNANIASRGWLETAYYYMGSDFRGRSDSYLLSYMSQMGGWSIMDYALNYTQKPDKFIVLGYASYLSSFALINSGTAATNYGYWYSGKENDGAAGWAFEPQKSKITWIQKQQQRGPWFYDGEIDLGFCAATRMACTIVVRDPVFGMIAYGGNLKQSEHNLSVIPRDGLRHRFFMRNGIEDIDIELNRDGFAKASPISYNQLKREWNFEIENRTADAHKTIINLKALRGKYQVTVDSHRITVVDCIDRQPTKIHITMETNKKVVNVKIKKQ